MSLQTIRTAVWAYLDVGSPTTAQDVLLLSAMNNVRQSAELRLDLEAARCVSYVTVAPTGTAISAAKAAFTSGAPSGSSVDVKSIEAVDVYSATDSLWVRGTYVSLEDYEARKERYGRAQLYDDQYDTGTHSPAVDITSLPYGTRSLVLHHGLTLSTPLSTAIQVKLRGFKWLAAYATLDAADDWLVQRCASWFQWAVVCELNMQRQVFVQRAEGAIDIAEIRRLRDDEWDNVVLQNAFIHQEHHHLNG
jgi:hypothetical protein